jgi:DNA-binding protein HU-beta
MNKNELVAAVAEHAGMTKVDATKAVDAFCDAVTEALSSGDEVRLVGFGTFAVADRKATEGRNPRTGAAISIAASKLPKFKPGKQLKDACNLDAAAGGSMLPASLCLCRLIFETAVEHQGRLAQLVERFVYTEDVGSSSLSSPTMSFSRTVEWV